MRRSRGPLKGERRQSACPMLDPITLDRSGHAAARVTGGIPGFLCQPVTLVPGLVGLVQVHPGLAIEEQTIGPGPLSASLSCHRHTSQAQGKQLLCPLSYGEAEVSVNTACNFCHRWHGAPTQRTTSEGSPLKASRLGFANKLPTHRGTACPDAALLGLLLATHDRHRYGGDDGCQYHDRHVDHTERSRRNGASWTLASGPA
jgi:hypothetical protein